MLALRLFAVAALAGGLLAGCADAKTMAVSSKQPMVAAGGDVAVGSFSSVELQGGGHVALRYGAVQRVSLVSGSTEFTRFHIEQGNKLVIDACNDKCPSNYDLSIVIVTPHITGVAISGGGRIESAAGFPAQERLAAAVDGGGDIDVRSIDAKEGEAAVNGGGKIRIHVDTRLTAAVEGGGAIRYSGTDNVTSAVDGGGSIARDGT